ncbi:polysaccharide biosynthesis/export family protein [Acuticoccus mangrovi]|uniref:Polysaccharide export protein n=1 Tax=Acuticoccus mangrovi TaxID=2796142 RepID=A0A934MNX5_9HYPH|nr:polysaccharide biosynthesis/export family protein [Acuticoccus mangrovi]MBJ3778589.1 polysaccharide export protein [Acuticoccus mangrovi]
MHRLAVLILLLALTACATQGGDAPCVSATSVSGCPVYKAPEDALAPCTPTCQAPSEPIAPPLPSGFQPWAEGFQDELRFVVGDELQVKLPFYEDEDVETKVAPDGNIYIGLIGEVQAVGRTPASLEAELEKRYSRYLRFPDVGVVPTGFGSRQVFVGGEVKEPGAYVISGPTGVLEAVFQAGGFLTTANTENVVLIRRGPNDLPMLRYLDLKSFANGGTPTENTLLRPFDIVFVPKSGIAKLNLFIKQYIEGVVPFNHNFNYTLYEKTN